jgi:hypothetical protein
MICGQRAIAFHLNPDGGKTYLCAEHLPAIDNASVESNEEAVGERDD